MHFFFATAIRPWIPFPRVVMPGSHHPPAVSGPSPLVVPSGVTAPGASPSVTFTILQHLAPRRKPLSRKFHTFHLAAICRVFRQLLLFAGLAQVGVRERCAGPPRPDKGA